MEGSFEISIEQFAYVFDKSHDGIIITDREGNVVYATPSSDSIIAPHAFTGRNVRNLVDSGAYSRSIIWKAIETKERQTGVVHIYNGRRVVSTATPLLGEDGEVRYTITNVRRDDVLEQYTDELRQAEGNIHRYKSAVNYINSANIGDIVTRDPQMLRMLDYLRKVSKSQGAVLLTGESGTGKELLAAFIHKRSPRSGEPFIPVNCAAIPRELMESEFFGYDKGAFSGASPKGKPGFFELANHGTLFLDEVAEMPLDIQAKFLRVLESGEFRRIGGTIDIQTDVRIVSATNRNLEELVWEGAFREDLYYRLNVIPVNIPPLRERKSDIMHLADFFLQRANSRYNTNCRLTPALNKAMEGYDWPGNVRELKNFIERLVFAPDDEALYTGLKHSSKRNKQAKKTRGKHHLNNDEMPQDVSANYGEALPFAETPAIGEEKLPHESLNDLTKRVEKQQIERVVALCNGNISKAAEQLGLHRSMLYRKMKDYHIQFR